MKVIMVRYKVKSDQAEKNKQYIKKVFESLTRQSPPNLRYASFVLEDGVSFVHIVSLEAEDDSNPLSELPAFNAFTAEIKQRCEEPPVAAPMTDVGSYNFFL